MPPPVVTTHRVGKNAVVTIDDTVRTHVSGSVRTGGGTDTLTYADGFDYQAPTNSNASGDLTLIVLHGDEVAFVKHQFINLLISDGTNDIFNGVAMINEVTDSFANDQGWTYSFTWSSHGVFYGAGEVAP